MKRVKRSKVTVKTFIVLQKISVSNKKDSSKDSDFFIVVSTKI